MLPSGRGSSDGKPRVHLKLERTCQLMESWLLLPRFKTNEKVTKSIAICRNQMKKVSILRTKGTKVSLYLYYIILHNHCFRNLHYRIVRHKYLLSSPEAWTPAATASSTQSRTIGAGQRIITGRLTTTDARSQLAASSDRVHIYVPTQDRAGCRAGLVLMNSTGMTAV